MSYPKQVDKFRRWAKLMIEGATVDREWTKTHVRKRGTTSFSRKRRRRRKKKNQDA